MGFLTTALIVVAVSLLIIVSVSLLSFFVFEVEDYFKGSCRTSKEERKRASQKEGDEQ